ncbi:2-amino-4-hydroxy-6-hydroxymethyldihydropteridine diphosphokinase [Algibacillus agarilyticus]|uniref:2-amino-4-hydroxy-6- hydroxymethyldihydropteridine diphosphokinase n=1 Tax=Algibacillus agarilyticus TaxID=2234133 RepID=UPI000DCF7FBA|nr:2-amino-4-hydroxy-6-hydroxymethyldihydropteridine diphosphokinase [Algibacillus agarilyticus]
MNNNAEKCYIGLGSNLATPIEQLDMAIMALSTLAQLSQLKVSSFYASQPMGPQDQPEYVNAVAEFIWQGDALSLLDALQKIEQEQGRKRKAERWGPRTLDLDILLFGSHQIHHARLIIPHYGMHLREFVLYPLQELVGNLILPNGENLNNLIQQCPINDLVKLHR